MECFLKRIWNGNLVKNARVGCQRSREEGIRTVCLSLSRSATEKGQKAARGFQRPDLNAGRPGAALRSPLRIWGNWRELGAESGGVGNRPGPPSSAPSGPA